MLFEKEFPGAFAAGCPLMTERATQSSPANKRPLPTKPFRPVTACVDRFSIRIYATLEPQEEVPDPLSYLENASAVRASCREEASHADAN